MVLKLYPNPILRKVCTPINKVKDNHIRLAAKMHAVMQEHNGVGLAGPQVGLTIQIIVINTMSLDKEYGVKRTMYNPVILAESKELFTFNEGCLSFTGKFIEKSRPYTITVEYINSQNQRIVEQFHKVSATAVAHEIEHLQGKLLID